MKANMQNVALRADIELQNASDAEYIPELVQFTQWVNAVLDNVDYPAQTKTVELSVRVVDLAESQRLNHQYRNKNKPTNVLSFPLADENLPVVMLGDLVICASIVEQEAQQQSKELEAHWAHMVIHGVLHLLGYDHEVQDQAEQMEGLEVRIMQGLGFVDPYIIG